MATDLESPLWRLTSKKAGAIVPLGGGGTGCPFYCVHSISGDATSLQTLARGLGTERQIYGIQIPKEKLNSHFAASVRAIAEYYADSITGFQPEGPLVLGGWSAGSFIALEMAQILKERGRDVPLLIALDGFLLNAGGSIPAWHLLYYWKMVQNLPRWLADKIAGGWKGRGAAYRAKHKLKLALASVIPLGHTVETGSGVDAFLDISGWPPEQAAFVRVLFDAIERYEPRPYNGRVLVYSAKTQALLRPGRVEATWKGIATMVEFVEVDGTHVTMIREPHVKALAAHLRRQLFSLTLAPSLVSAASSQDGGSRCLPLTTS